MTPRQHTHSRTLWNRVFSGGLIGVVFWVAASQGGWAQGENAATDQGPEPKSGPETVLPGLPERIWPKLAEDDLHDPENPALEFLQEPSEALGILPFAYEGNQVDWAAALRNGDINPRTNVFPETKVNVLDLDVIMENTAGMPLVKFPHKQHTEWLDCSNCHDKIFKKGRGTNGMNMMMILSGYYCGQCHGAVSFPLTQCDRCHSVAREAGDAG